MNTTSGRTAIPHEVICLDIAIRERYDDFLRRFESAVPEFDGDRAAVLVERKAAWSEVVADVAASAPHDFLLCSPGAASLSRGKQPSWLE